MAISKARLRALALPGVKLRIDELKQEISGLLEEFPELQTSHDVVAVPVVGSSDHQKPTIGDQALQILASASEPMKGGDVYRVMQTYPNPATANDTNVHTGLVKLASSGLLKRSDEGYLISAKGRKYLQGKAGSETATGEQA